MRKHASLLATALVIGMAGLPVAAQDVRQAIEAENQKFVEAFNAGDIEGAVQIYTDDATILPPAHPRIEGREDILRFWQAMVEGDVAGIELETETVEAANGFAYEIGTFEITAPEEAGQAPVEGKYVVVWKQTDDGWKWHVDIWNANP